MEQSVPPSPTTSPCSISLDEEPNLQDNSPSFWQSLFRQAVVIEPLFKTPSPAVVTAVGAFALLYCGFTAFQSLWTSRPIQKSVPIFPLNTVTIPAKVLNIVALHQADQPIPEIQALLDLFPQDNTPSVLPQYSLFDYFSVLYIDKTSPQRSYESRNAIISSMLSKHATLLIHLLSLITPVMSTINELVAERTRDELSRKIKICHKFQAIFTDDRQPTEPLNVNLDEFNRAMKKQNNSEMVDGEYIREAFHQLMQFKQPHNINAPSPDDATLITKIHKITKISNDIHNIMFKYNVYDLYQLDEQQKIQANVISTSKSAYQYYDDSLIQHHYHCDPIKFNDNTVITHNATLYYNQQLKIVYFFLAYTSTTPAQFDKFITTDQLYTLATDIINFFHHHGIQLVSSLLNVCDILLDAVPRAAPIVTQKMAQNLTELCAETNFSPTPDDMSMFQLQIEQYFSSKQQPPQPTAYSMAIATVSDLSGFLFDLYVVEILLVQNKKNDSNLATNAQISTILYELQSLQQLTTNLAQYYTTFMSHACNYLKIIDLYKDEIHICEGFNNTIYLDYSSGADHDENYDLSLCYVREFATLPWISNFPSLTIRKFE